MASRISDCMNELPTKFCISAPGKVILHGEHSVVYGHLAIAASLNLRTKVEYFQLETDKERFVHFKMPNVNVDIKLSSSCVSALLSTLEHAEYLDYKNPGSVKFENLLEALQTFLASQAFYQGLESQQLVAVKSCLFLMVSILGSGGKTKLASLKPFMLCVSSELPVGAGAGSSASFCVCLATVFVCLASFMDDSQGQFCLDEKTKALVSSWAFLGERITHGNPSGLDNSICTYGSLMAFRRPNTIMKITLTSGIQVLLVDTKVSRNTRTLVDKVAKLKENHEVTVKTIMQAMDSISSEAENLFKLLDEAKKCQAKQEIADLFPRMEELWSMNHSLLQALGVSHPSLEQVVQLSKEHKLSGKLTGAGGGGFAIVLLPIIVEGFEAVIASLNESLKKCGFDVKEVVLGGPGVQLHM